MRRKFLSLEDHRGSKRARSSAPGGKSVLRMRSCAGVSRESTAKSGGIWHVNKISPVHGARRRGLLLLVGDQTG